MRHVRQSTHGNDKTDLARAGPHKYAFVGSVYRDAILDDFSHRNAGDTSYTKALPERPVPFGRDVYRLWDRNAGK